MRTQEFLLCALDQRYEKYLAERKRFEDEFSEEAVHDLRVSARRLLALIESLQTLYPHSRLKKLRRDFKDRLDSLDELRDTQVMLAETAIEIASLPEIAPLRKFLQKREKHLLKVAERDVRAFKTSAISRRIRNVRAVLVESTDGQDLTAGLFAAIDDACLTVNLRKGRVDPAQSSTIHRVRVAFKKFRYMLEISHPILPGFPENQLKSMHKYQTAMGEIQDVEVMLHTLSDFAIGKETYDPQPVRHFYEQRHAELINIYIENMNEFFSFWRETPDRPFPWES